VATLDLRGNPCCLRPDYPACVVTALPNLQRLDGKRIVRHADCETAGDEGKGSSGFELVEDPLPPSPHPGSDPLEDLLQERQRLTLSVSLGEGGVGSGGGASAQGSGSHAPHEVECALAFRVTDDLGEVAARFVGERGLAPSMVAHLVVRMEELVVAASRPAQAAEGEELRRRLCCL
jgi:hypothetical protein